MLDVTSIWIVSVLYWWILIVNRKTSLKLQTDAIIFVISFYSNRNLLLFYMKFFIGWSHASPTSQRILLICTLNWFFYWEFYMDTGWSIPIPINYMRWKRNEKKNLKSNFLSYNPMNEIIIRQSSTIWLNHKYHKLQSYFTNTHLNYTVFGNSNKQESI